MKKFVKWMEVSSVHPQLWNRYNPLGKIYKGLEKRQKIADERDSFINKKLKTRNSWRMAFTRYGRIERAHDVYGFVIRRMMRVK